MSSQSSRIMVTIRLENDLYHRFHEIAEMRGAAKNKLLVLLIRNFVDGKCTCFDKETARRAVK